MNVNTPKAIPLCYYAVCVDDSKPKLAKPIQGWIEKGKVYTVYSVANALNAEGQSFYIKDQDGNKVEPNEDIPTFRSDRFNVIFVQYLN